MSKSFNYCWIQGYGDLKLSPVHYITIKQCTCSKQNCIILIKGSEFDICKKLKLSDILDLQQGRRRRGGQGGHKPPPPHFQKWGGTSGFVPPPTFGQSKCSNFTICSYFVVKNTFFFKIFLARFARQLY